MIDPKKFEAMKKAYYQAERRVKEAECKVKAAREEYMSAESERNAADMLVREYWAKCME